MSVHVCGLTGMRFDSEEEYLSHTSHITGHTPREIAHHGAQGIRVSEKALARTGSLQGKQQKKILSELETVRSENTDSKIRKIRSQKTSIFNRLTR